MGFRGHLGRSSLGQWLVPRLAWYHGGRYRYLSSRDQNEICTGAGSHSRRLSLLPLQILVLVGILDRDGHSCVLFVAAMRVFGVFVHPGCKSFSVAYCKDLNLIGLHLCLSSSWMKAITEPHLPSTQMQYDTKE